MIFTVVQYINTDKYVDDNMKPILHSGLLFVVVGLSFLLWATNYKIGDASSMGPGYFPILLGMILIVLGLINVLKSIVTREWSVTADIAWRPLILILLANILFGILLPKLGLVLAIFALVIVSSNALPGTKIKEVISLATFLSVLSCVTFVWALNMNLNILPKF